MWFIAGQVALGYSIAGLAKLLGPRWRDGSALVGILSTRTYGNARVKNVIEERQWIGKISSWMVVLWECSFVLIFLVPWPEVWEGALLGGLAFHWITALVMRLWDFALTWTAAYVAVFAVLASR
jgi:hypothetical protein